MSLLINLLMRMIAMLPLTLLQILGSFFGYLTFLFPNDLKRITKINIALCFPNLSSQALRYRIKKTLIETGKTAFEMPALWQWPTPKLYRRIKEVHGESAARDALAKGKGIIFLSPHLGAWEIINPYLAAHYPMVIMYRPAKRAYLNEFIYSARKRCGNTMVPTDISGVKALYRALNEGKTVGLLPDQDPGNNGGEFAPFFNIPTLTMTLVSRLAQKNQTPIFLIYAERLGIGKGYRIEFIPASTLLADKDPLTATSALNTELENCIRKIPDQYQWGYKRFKRNPHGFPRVY